jgi:hypothetical protein
MLIFNKKNIRHTTLYIHKVLIYSLYRCLDLDILEAEKHTVLIMSKKLC